MRSWQDDAPCPRVQASSTRGGPACRQPSHDVHIIWLLSFSCQWWCRTWTRSSMIEDVHPPKLPVAGSRADQWKRTTETVPASSDEQRSSPSRRWRLTKRALATTRVAILTLRDRMVICDGRRIPWRKGKKQPTTSGACCYKCDNKCQEEAMGRP